MQRAGSPRVCLLCVGLNGPVQPLCLVHPLWGLQCDGHPLLRCVAGDGVGALWGARADTRHEPRRTPPMRRAELPHRRRPRRDRADCRMPLQRLLRGRASYLGGGGGMGMCPQPVFTAPAAPSSKVLWQTRQDLSRPPRLNSGPQATADPGQPRRREARHMHRTCPHTQSLGEGLNTDFTNSRHVHTKHHQPHLDARPAWKRLFPVAVGRSQRKRPQCWAPAHQEVGGNGREDKRTQTWDRALRSRRRKTPSDPQKLPRNRTPVTSVVAHFFRAMPHSATPNQKA